MPLTPFIAIIQLVIQFCNSFMKLCCDSCHPQVSILAFRDDGEHFLVQYLQNSAADFKIMR